MKFIFKALILIVLFFLALLAFSPKEKAYNLAEQIAKKQNVIISDEIRDEKLFGLDIKGAKLFYDGINAAIVKNIDLTTFLVYSNVDIKDIVISSQFKDMLPNRIENINIKHSVLEFDKVKINASGEFGSFVGAVNLLDRKITGVLNPSNIMKSKYRNILREFKLKDGKYNYEFRF